MGHRSLTAVLFLAGCLSSGAHAQNLLEAPADSTLRSVISRIGANNRDKIRVTTRETGRLQGNAVSLVGDSIFIGTESGPRAVAMGDVDSLWIYRGTAASLFGLIAGLPCALFGGAVGGFIGSDPDGKPSSTKSALFPIIGILAGGAVCGFAGAVIGSLIERWPLEYARPG